ncbi:excinuclease ABC subunit UvrC [Candidatus Rariloculus sp.]|uniref:excinuclease ABC subunit UvrC n=1 Tax=Candidatus Rariloculus sp. TaxID=3101265 RepID=UPI003D143AF9
MKQEPKAPFDPTDLLRHMTHRPGIYRMLDAKGQLIYVGKARDLRRRVSSYFKGRVHDAKTTAMLRTVGGVAVTVTRTEAEALMLEYNLIKRHKPRFNVVLRDDKSYPYIYISTDHEFPRLSFYRGSTRKKGRLFGPYPSAGSVRETLNQLQKVFRVRQCEDSYFANRSRPCLQHQIERCTAPCVGLITKEEYRRDIDHAVLFLKGDSDTVTERLVERMEHAAGGLRYERAAQYRDQLSQLKRIQSSQLMSRTKGDFDVIGLAAEGGVCCVAVMFFRGGRSLGSRTYFPSHTRNAAEDEIIRAFLLQYYGAREAPKEILVSRSVPEADAIAAMLGERAGRRVMIKWRLRGDRARWVEIALTNARHGAELKNRSTATVASQLAALAELLDLDTAPSRLECFDISHTGGESTVASCVVFGVEGPLKADYRRFNIQHVPAGDDYAALRQVLSRRYSRVKAGEAPMPDVVFIDGGRGQLSQALSVLQELQMDQLRVIGIAKGEGRKPGRERLYLPERNAALRVKADSPALHLIQQIRDEAHRFAIAGHRAQRQKRRNISPLEHIAGLGPKRRRDLLRQFGGLQAVARAGIDDLARVKGISRRLATSIYERFHTE